MKLFFAAIVMILAFVSLNYGQTIQTAEGKRLIEVEKLIPQVELKISRKKAELETLLSKYSEEFPSVKLVKLEIPELEKNLAALNLEKKDLLSKKLIITLPNNQIELLKLIIMQNQEIIELLRQRQTI